MRFDLRAMGLSLGAMIASSRAAVRELVSESDLIGRFGRVLRRWRTRASGIAARRSLIGEILVLQLVVAAIVGVLAAGGLWLASTLAVREETRAWAVQWINRLDALGAPLYRGDDTARTYLAQFAEVSLVRYYSADGETIAAESSNGGEPLIPPLNAAELKELTSATGPEQDVVGMIVDDNPVVRVARPVWNSSTATTPSNEGSNPVGYVELTLDFSKHQAYESRSVLRTLAFGFVVLIVFMLSSWLICRRALLPLSVLQAPLARLADGQADFSLPASAHREIAAVANALKATASALDEKDQKLNELASRDELTGLLNKSAFQALLAGEMESVAASGRTSALLYADVDQFKYVNDSLGDSAGDRLLKAAGDWFAANLRPGDAIARFGGDEFGMLLRDVTIKEAAAVGAGLVKRMQRESFTDGGRAVNLRCSIGATMVRGTRVEPAKLLRRAAGACYQAKANGRSRFCFHNFASRDTVEMAADADWSQRIQKALKEDAFVLHYQPIVDLRTRGTVYYEVLLRMRVDDDELAFPATFLPTAARLGLMVDIDRWVIRQALRSLAALLFTHGDVRLALNVSGSTFDRPDFFSYLETELKLTGVPLDAIVIEITEQTALRDLSGAASRMNDLVSRGCRFAIDDFGSGYCSYSYLKSLPLAFVKIDGSFIINLAADKVDRKIVAAIAEVAAATDCETIAEHVRDYETLRLLERLGVAYAQGYFLGKPAERLAPATIPAPMVTADRRMLARRAEPCRPRRGPSRKAAVGGEVQIYSSDGPDD